MRLCVTDIGVRLPECQRYLAAGGARYGSHRSRLAVLVKKTSEKPAYIKNGHLGAIRNTFFSESVHAEVMDRGRMGDVHGWQKEELGSI